MRASIHPSLGPLSFSFLNSPQLPIRNKLSLQSLWHILVFGSFCPNLTFVEDVPAALVTWLGPCHISHSQEFPNFSLIFFLGHFETSKSNLKGGERPPTKCHRAYCYMIGSSHSGVKEEEKPFLFKISVCLLKYAVSTDRGQLFKN